MKAGWKLAALCGLLLALTVAGLAEGGLVLPSDLETIGEEAFLGVGAETVTVPEGVTSIGGRAFANSAVKAVYLPSTLTDIASSAFDGSPNAVALVKAAEPAALCRTRGIPFIRYAAGDEGATVVSCGGMGETVALPDAIDGMPVTSIGSRAFEGSGAVGVCLPDTVTAIASDAFDGSDALALIKTSAQETLCQSQGAPYLKYSVGTDGVSILKYTGEKTSVKVPAAIEGKTVTEISYDCFRNHGALTAVTLSEGVVSIGASAFEGCMQLERVHLPESLTEIKNRALGNCPRLAEINFPAGLQYIRPDAFYSSSKRAEGAVVYELPDNLREVNSSVFRDCGAAICVTRDSATEALIRADGYIYTHYGETDFRFRYFSGEGTEEHRERLTAYVGTEAATAEIPPYVWLIDDNAFKEHAELTKVVVPEGVTRIGNYAFQDCVNLTDITLPESLAELRNSVFSGCGSAAEADFTVALPSNIADVWPGAFDSARMILVCDKESATAGTISNRGYSFVRSDRAEETDLRYKCDYFNHVWGWGLYDYVGEETAVRVPDDCANVSGAMLRDKVTNGLALVCGQCSDAAEGVSRAEMNFTLPGHEDFRYRIIDGILYVMNWVGTGTEIAIPEAAEYIAAGWDEQIRQNSFQNLTEVVRLTVPEGVTRINEGDFSGCVNLTDITLPSTLKSLGTKVFRYCGQNLDEPFYLTLPDNLEELAGRFGGANSFEDLNAVLVCGKTSQTAALLSDSNYVYTCPGEYDYRYRYDTYPNNSEAGRQVWLVGYTGEGGTANIPAGIYGIRRYSSNTTDSNWPTFYGNGFYGSGTVTKAVIPEGTVVIEDSAFSGCVNLTDITLPSTLKSLSTKVFRYCGQNLDEPFYLTLPDNLEELAGRFGGANSFEDLNAVLVCGKTSQTAALLSDSNYVYTCPGEYDYRYRYEINPNYSEEERQVWLVGYTGEGGTANIPAGIYGIRRYSSNTTDGNWPTFYGNGFYGNGTVTKAVIPEGTVVIEDSAFCGCVNLTDITFPNSLKVMKNHAFERCGKNSETLHYYVLPDDMTEVSTNVDAGWGAFTDINQGRVAAAPGSSTALQLSGIDTYNHGGTYLFALKGHESDGLLYLYKEYSTDDGTVNRLELRRYEGSGSELVIPGGCGIYRIEAGVFENCEDLERVTIPDGLAEIGARAFSGCALLHGGEEEFVIRVPDTVRRIGAAAFQNVGSGYTAERFYLVLPGGLSEFDISAVYQCNAVLVASGGAAAQALYDNWYYYYTSLEDAIDQTDCQYRRYYVDGVETWHEHYGRQ